MTEEGKQTKKKRVCTNGTDKLAGGKVAAASVGFLHASEREERVQLDASGHIFQLFSNRKEDRLPVDRLTEKAVSLVTKVTGAVDSQCGLVAVGILVTATVVFRAEVWSCGVQQSHSVTRRLGKITFHFLPHSQTKAVGHRGSGWRRLLHSGDWR